MKSFKFLKDLDENSFTPILQKITNEFIFNIEKKVKDEESKINNILKTSTSRRVAQIILKLFFKDFRNSFSSHIEQKKKPETYFEKELHSKNYVIDWKRNNIKFKKKFYLSYLFKFIIIWNFVLFFVILKSIKNLLKRNKEKNKILFFMGDLRLNKSNIKDFIDFTDNGSIDILNNDFILIKGKTNTQLNEKITTSKKPYLSAINHTNIKFSDFFYFIFYHFKYMFFFCNIFFRRNILFLLSIDLSFLSLFKLYDKKNLIKDYVISNSEYNSQQIWFDITLKFKTHMIWYSTNFRGADFKTKNNYKLEGNPFYSLLRIQNHWAWNKEQALWWNKKDPNTNTIIIGPILFKKPDFNITLNNKRKVNIACFDITPMKIEWCKKNVFGYGKIYYTHETCSKFLNDIIKLSNLSFGNNCSIYLKSKRNYNFTVHDKTYISYLDTLEEKKKLIRTDNSINLFGLINEVDLVICLPYTSPVYVAEMLKVPSIFYDPTEQLSNFQNLPESIPFISGPKKLASYLENFSATIKLSHEKR